MEKENTSENTIRNIVLADELNPFIMSTAKDYDMTYLAVEIYYNKYGSTPMFYEKLEEHIKERSY